MKRTKKYLIVTLLLVALILTATACTRYDAVRLTVEATNETFDVGIPRGSGFTISYNEAGAVDISVGTEKTALCLMIAPKQLESMNSYVEAGVFECTETGQKDNLNYRFVKCEFMDQVSYAYIATIEGAQAGFMMTFNGADEQTMQNIFGAINVRVVSK